MISTVHTSLIAQYLELSQIFSIPFIVLYHLYTSYHFFLTFFAIFMINIAFIIILNLTQKAMKTVTFHIFNRFVYDEETDVKLPTFVLGSITSSIRLIARYQSNPIVLNRFMENQKHTRLRTSVLIEICRFLAIFPSYRFTMLEMIKNFTTKSIYNDFTLFMFEYLLAQHNSTSMSVFYTKCFDHCYTGFITHSYFYWKARKKKKIFRAFFEAFACSLYVNETEKILNGLFYLYPFVPNLHKYLADVLLNIHGDYEGYKKEMKFCLSIEKKKLTIFDPILQANAKINPKILQYCDQDSHILYNFSATSSPMNTVNSSTTFSLFQKKHKNIEKVKKKKNVASKIIKSERNIPYLHILHFIFPPLIIIVFVILTNEMIKDRQSNTRDFMNSINMIEKLFYGLASSIFIPFVMQRQPGVDYNNTNECQKLFTSIPTSIGQYYHYSPILSNKADLNLIIAFRGINNLIKDSQSICDIVENMPKVMNQITKENLESIFRENHNCYNNVKGGLDLASNLYNMKLFVLYGSIAFIIFLVVYFIVNCISLNTIMRDNHIAIDFLSSEKRVSPVLQEPQIRDNLWDQLIGFDTSFVISESSLDSEFYPDNDIITTSASFLSTALFLQPTPMSTNQFNSQSNSNLKFTKNIEPASIPPVSLESTESTEFNQSSHEQSGMAILPSSFTGSETNLFEHSKLIDPTMIKLDDKDNLDLDPIMTDNNNNNNNCAVIASRSSSVPLIDSQNGEKAPKDVNMDELHVYLKGRKSALCRLGFNVVLIILLPWIILYLCTILGIYPLIDRRNYDCDFGEIWLNLGEDFNSAILLLNQTLTLYKTRTINHSYLEIINSTFSKRIGKHSEMYFNEQCFEFNEIQCISVYDVFQEISKENCSNDFIEFYALPIVVTFTENLLKDFSDITQQYDYGNSIRSSFFTLVIVFFIVSIIYGYKKTVSLKKSFNSLFHFPSFEPKIGQTTDQTVNDTLNSKDDMSSKEKVGSKDSMSSNASINVDIKIDVSSTKSEALINVPLTNSDPKNNDDFYRFPTNIIIVTFVAETNEIYSVSDTCQKILNKKPSDFICKNFSKYFPLKKTDQNFDIREYNGKTFISKTIITGKIAKTVLIESLKSENKTKSINIIQKLINFMPNYFAKQFSEEFINFFNFYRSILIFIRINPNAGQIENFFSLLSKLDQTFFNIEFIRSNGSVLTCVCGVQDELEILLFLRDLIISSEESCKKKMENFALKSVYIDLIDELNAEVEAGDIEPEIIFEECLFYEIEQITYFVDDNIVAFSDELIKIVNSIPKFSNQTKNVNGKIIHTIPFKLFSDEFQKNLYI